MTSKEIAQTILHQLGGNAFLKMTGAKMLVALKSGLQFNLPGRGFCKQSINRVEVILDPSDTYTIRFCRARRSMKQGFILKIVEERSGVYAEDLARIFRETTGLETRMPRVVGINAKA